MPFQGVGGTLAATWRVTAVTASRWRYRIWLGSLDTLAVSIVMFPQQSVLSRLYQGASWPAAGGLYNPSAAFGSALRPSARFAAQSFAARDFIVMPECCIPVPPLADVSVAQQADMLRDMSPTVLIDELDAIGAEHALSPLWLPAVQQPRRWLDSMADACLDTWAAMQPQWQAARPLFDREVQRVGTAAVRGGMEALLNSLHPDMSYADGVLAFAFSQDRCTTLGGRRLALIPMIARRDMLIVDFEHPEVCYIGYPVRPPGPGTQPAASGALALVLGPLRAAALQALHQPLTVGGVADAVQCAPTTATYHLQQLAATGMIARERRGTTIWVTRTSRGDKIVDLLAD
jgi:Helix-turn-helix domain